MVVAVHDLLDIDGVDIISRFECQRCHKKEEYSDGTYVPVGWLTISWNRATQKLDDNRKIICEECSEYFGLFIEGMREDVMRDPTEKPVAEDDLPTVESVTGAVL